MLTLNGEEFAQTQCFLPTDDPTDPDDLPEMDPNPYVDQGATADDQCNVQEGTCTLYVPLNPNDPAPESLAEAPDFMTGLSLPLR